MSFVPRRGYLQEVNNFGEKETAPILVHGDSFFHTDEKSLSRLRDLVCASRSDTSVSQ